MLIDHLYDERKLVIPKIIIVNLSQVLEIVNMMVFEVRKHEIEDILFAVVVD